jgi:hypothetical protein
MASMQSWRKAYGAIKDTTTVSLANINSDFKVRPPDPQPLSPDFFRPIICAESVGTLVFSVRCVGWRRVGAPDLRWF